MIKREGKETIMKASFLRALKNRNVPLVTKVIGLLSFITLCIICLVGPIVTLAGNNPSTVVFVKDYGNINQFVVMPNGQLSIKPKKYSILHTINRRFASSIAHNALDACATLDALVIDGSPNPLDSSPDALSATPNPLGGTPDTLSATHNPLGGSPNPLGGTPDALSATHNPLGGTPDTLSATLDALGGNLSAPGGNLDPLDNATCLSFLSAGSPNALDGSPNALDGSPDPLDGSPDSLDISSCSDGLDLGGSPSPLNGSPSPLNGSPSPLNGSPSPLGTCTNGITQSKKMSILDFQMPPGEILAVQSGKDVVVAISLGHNQVLMPNGTTMNLQ